MKAKSIISAILLMFLMETVSHAQLSCKRGEKGCGLYDQETNEWIIPARYDQIRVIRDISDKIEPFLACRLNGKYALFTSKGKRFTNFEYDDIHSKKNGLLVIVANNDLWGVMDIRGHYLYPRELSSAYFTSDGSLKYKRQSSSETFEVMSLDLAIKYKITLKRDEKNGIGDLVMLPEPEVASDNALADSNVSNSSGSVKSLQNLHPVEGTKYFNVQNLSSLSLNIVSNGHFIVFDKINGDAFIFDKNGDLTSSLKLSNDDHCIFDNERCIVELSDGNWAIIDTAGKVVKNLGSLFSTTRFIDGVARNVAKGAIYYIDAEGKLIYPNLVETLTEREIFEGFRFPLYSLVEGRRIHFSDYRYGYLDEKGNIVINPHFVEAHDYSEGLAAVAIRDGNQRMWGFITPSGDFAIKPIFSQEPDDFHCGYAAVRKQNGEYVYINREGAVSSDSYQYAGPFINGHAIVRKLESDRKAMSTVIDTDFKEIGNSSFIPKNVSYDFASGLIYANGNIYSSDGVLLYEQVYHRLEFNEGISAVNGSKTKGYVNSEGEYIIIFQQNEF